MSKVLSTNVYRAKDTPTRTCTRAHTDPKPNSLCKIGTISARVIPGLIQKEEIHYHGSRLLYKVDWRWTPGENHCWKCSGLHMEINCLQIRIPKTIVTDNGTQLDSKLFWSFYDEYNICLWFASVAHLQTTDFMEAANKIVLKALKKKADIVTKEDWPDLISEILCSYQTTYKIVRGNSINADLRFKSALAYGSRDSIPSHHALRPISQRIRLQMALHLLEERREGLPTSWSGNSSEPNGTTTCGSDLESFTQETW